VIEIDLSLGKSVDSFRQFVGLLPVHKVKTNGFSHLKELLGDKTPSLQKARFKKIFIIAL
jgi:hypothetical protein